MKRFTCVDIRLFDGGGKKIFVYDVMEEEKPEDRKMDNKMCDNYRYYFSSYSEAKEFEKKVVTGEFVFE